MSHPTYPFLSAQSLALRPDKTTASRAWEESWSDDLARLYARSPQDMRRFVNVEPKEKLKLYDVDGIVLQFNTKRNGVIAMQKDFFTLVAHELVHGDFESRWKASDHKEREKHILQALCNASSLQHGHAEQDRILCPEITLAHLSSDDGNSSTYANLLKQMLPSVLPTKQNEIHEMVYVEHPNVEALLALTENEKKVPGTLSYARGTRTRRMAFMTTVLWSTFLSFAGHQQILEDAKGPSLNSKDFQKINSAFVKEHGKDQFREFMAQIKEDRKEESLCCFKCGRGSEPASASEPKIKFFKCSRCSSVGRKVFYCSPECQSEDWKKGHPVPHKVFCGKLKTNLSEATSKSESTSAPHEPTTVHSDHARNAVPDPDPSYKRSQALVYHASLLQQPYYEDYFVILPDDTECGLFVATTVSPTDKEIFHLARHRALRRGDPAAVQVMYNKLVPRLKMAGFSEVDMRAQLLREYGVRVKVGDNGTLNLRSASITEQLAVHLSITATRHGMALQRQGVVI